MDLERLLQPAGPRLHLLPTDTQARDLLWAVERAHPGRVVGRVVRGSKMRTTPALFDEFAAALQFPDYFGENWNAFDECLRDLEWLPAGAVALLITAGQHVLERESPDERHKFWQVLDQDAREWAEPGPGESPPRAFHVLIAGHESALEKELREAGVAFDRLP
jgi:Barstar (barnase inhibitor)